MNTLIFHITRVWGQAPNQLVPVNLSGGTSDRWEDFSNKVTCPF